MSPALTRRGALCGAAAAAIGLAAGVAPALALALSTDDRRLIELADEMWAIHHAAEAFTVAHRGGDPLADQLQWWPE